MVEHFLAQVGAHIDVIIATLAVGIGWLSTQFRWWHSSTSLWVKWGVPFAIFITFLAFVSLFR